MHETDVLPVGDKLEDVARQQGTVATSVPLDLPNEQLVAHRRKRVSLVRGLFVRSVLRGKELQYDTSVSVQQH